MKKAFLLTFLAFSVIVCAQSKMYIHQGSVTNGAPLSQIDSMYFGGSGKTLNFSLGGNTAVYSLSDIDSISFTDNTDTIFVNYDGSSVSVINPMAYEGISVSSTGSYVTITSTTDTKDITYKISGSTTEGMLKIYSGKRFNLVLSGVNITNPSGPAINIQSKNKASITLTDGTVNILTDGTSYDDTLVTESGDVEDQTAAFYSKGDLVFSGAGSLTVNGTGANKHAVFSKDEIDIESGQVTITSAAKDGLHGDGIVIKDGTVNINSTGDAIDGDEGAIKISGGTVTSVTNTEGSDGITCDSTLEISGGTVNVTVGGNQSKGIKAGQVITLSSGNITINTSGNAVLETSGSGYDLSYCTAIKGDTLVNITGADITIKCTGVGGKGISSDNNIIITAGNVNITTTGNGASYKNSSGVTDVYNATCLKADSSVIILGGTVITSSSGSAGKGISADAGLTIGDDTNTPVVSVTTTGTSIAESGSGMNREYAEAKAISCNGAVVINNGTVTITSADDGIKSEVSVTINGGTVNIAKSVEGIESPLITVNAGDLSIAASDDGFNATKGNGGEQNDGSYLYLKGGNVYVNTTNGDGLDSNGNIVMSGGTVVVNGPSSNPEVGIDYNGTFIISGGILVATGPNSGNMIQATSTSSSQYAIKATSSSQVSSSTLFHLQDASGTDIVTFKCVRNYYYVVISTPSLVSGGSYSIYTGGTYNDGTNSNGYYTGGTYSGGTFKKTFSITGKVTSVSF